ncbi:DUF2946 family protein [Noviherbaspirillum galbum]|uniref:DUF2946 family protein n=1 Tax=Noviherbaspirillum galbum TaxID=2709383 RepID=A0A6B3SIZ9_9BURK|nr:DUF2946 family protein [Noviherbaspirillum galbum]NEX60683.1 DUF2946 family protein [Noviherbaspirillum galbum]
MDDIVKQAMAKWPNVPHCYGWLALDARGNWRMRDERAQSQGLSGDRIANAALLAFIHRNYTHDDQGRWYFQNGPQRVYVNLEATPYIARTDPSAGFLLQTGQALGPLDAAWLTDDGRLLLRSGDMVALVDDRDTAQCLAKVRLNGAAASDDDILAWLGDPGFAGEMMFEHDGKSVALGRMARADIAGCFGFVAAPAGE